MVMRDTQVSSPASFTMSICHTCVVRPMCTGRAVPVTQPLVAARMWLAFGQHHAHAAVEQTKGLARTLIHWHTGT